MKIVTSLAIGSLLLLSACSDGDGARKALEAQGFDSIEIQGYSFFGCGEHDSYATAFKACRNQKCVNGVVCRGLLKGNTIRYY